MSNHSTAVHAIEKKIFIIRGHKVMLDRDLAALYQVKAIALRQQVKRNHKRFPPDFIFQLKLDEVKLLVSHSVIPSVRSIGGSLPYAFTEQGVAMLSSVLNSNRSIKVNIQIMRAFIRIKGLVVNYEDLRLKIAAMERKYGKQFAIVFDALNQLFDGPDRKFRIKGFGNSKQRR